MTKVVQSVFKFDPRKSVRIRERPRLSIKFDPDEDKTVQSFRDECDVNIILAGYKKTGVVLQRTDPPMYGDFTSVPDYLEAQNIIRTADQLFAGLSAEIRKRFDNDPAKFLAFCDDPVNGDELIKMGLREAPKPPPGPVEVRVVPDPAEPPK